jgi:hypothetical protein
MHFAYKILRVIDFQKNNILQRLTYFNLARISNMNFFISHIYREGNHCADKLASLGLTLHGFTWWNQIPPKIKGGFGRNRLGMPYFRFC